MPETVSTGVSASVPDPSATIGLPTGGGHFGLLRHTASSASHSKPGPVRTPSRNATYLRSHAITRRSNRPAGPLPVRHVPCPPQNHIIFTGTRLRRRIS